MLNFGKKFRASRDKKKILTCVVRKKISERSKKPRVSPLYIYCMIYVNEFSS